MEALLERAEDETYILTCWCCGNSFQYSPPKVLAGRAAAAFPELPAAFYQGSTICSACTPCMGGGPTCSRIS